MSRISIATTANCHDYKAKPTTPNQPMVANATNQTGEEREGAGSTCWLWGPRSASISHKFDMICAEYDNGYQPTKLPKVPFLPLICKYT